MLYDNVVCNELVRTCIICVPVLCMYIYSNIKRVNKYSHVHDFLKFTDRTVHIVVDKTTILPRTRIHLVCIDSDSKKHYVHAHNLYPKK